MSHNLHDSPYQPYSATSAYQPPPSHHAEQETFPVGRPLSYFPTHHEPLNQHEVDDPHNVPPALQHAGSPLSSRSPEWSGGGYSGGSYSGYQPSPSLTHPAPSEGHSADIPLVGLGVISSNLEAASHTQYSDTRTYENMTTPPQPFPNNGNHSYDPPFGSGVGGPSALPTLPNTQYGSQGDKYGQESNATALGRDQSYGQSHPPQQMDPELGQDGEPIPKVLLDPNVQRQLNKRKVWRPWFIWLVSAVQVAMLIFEFVQGYQRTGSFIQTSPFNPMIGPGTGTIIVVGARFVPCMRSTYLDAQMIACPDSPEKACSISEVCGFTPISSTGKPPDQWFRFITPIFLHGGIVHLLFNLLFQMRTGADLERDMGWWRIGIIYMTSGIVGFIFGGNFAPLLAPSMGASGAIFGLIGCLVLDLFQNWKLVIRPCWELTKLTIMILVSFAFGLLPFLDNFAHIGGFFAGILTGLVFMPVVYFSKRDRFIKVGLRFVSLPLIVLIIALGLINFYKGANNCSWCMYLR
ncbi:hypothetical protein BGW38_009507 [Lunasporangiospora selenospora]|uniref:Rhomboid-type serine protease n=1 Tax=Lunasporangiospora selenospora TaxID=979761 RepID=A0A9P6KG41_9FUNG|nr:hypothetical protein BGW38_009507 [Lunasporangiospora selenospora]